MQIAFRKVPFPEAQCRILDEACRAQGLLPTWFSEKEPLSPEVLRPFAALLGYFPPALLKNLPALQWVQLPCAGAERYCGAVGEHVVLTNASGAFNTAIAEYLLLGLLALYRDLPGYFQNQRARLWKPLGPARTVAGSAVLVIGCGEIGRTFAQKAAALGARVAGIHRGETPLPAPFVRTYTQADLPRALAGADACVLCLPATEETRGFFSEAAFRAMRPGAVLLNCGRGSTVDEAALVKALESGRLSGAVLDVFEKEPLPKDSPLWGMPNVVLTPHISGRDGDPCNAPEIFAIFRENLTRFAGGRPLTHIVDKARGY